MLPTIDFSLIGIVIAIWTVVKTIWGYFCGALNWITQRALAVLIGSKFWATATFLTVGLILISAFGWLLTDVLTSVGGLLVSQVDIPADCVTILSLYVDFEALTSLVSYAISAAGVYFVVCGTTAGLKHAQGVFTKLSQGWKN